MATPFQAQGSLSLPGAPGLPALSVPFGFSGQFDSKVEVELALPSAAGTKEVDFGTLPPEGVKCALVVYETLAGAPDLGVSLNGASPIALSTGGFLLLASPVPTVGVTSMTLSYEGAGRVRIWLLG